MLVLGRHKDESIVVKKNGVEIGRITVVEVSGDKTRLGFDFPREYEIDREEIAESKAQGRKK